MGCPALQFLHHQLRVGARQRLFRRQGPLPERFEDVDPGAKADEIFTFLVGKPVFSVMNEGFSGRIFSKIILEE